MHFRDQLSINEIVRRTSLSRNTIYGYFRTWKLSGLWDKVLTLFRETYRISTGKNARPTAAIIDAQSVKKRDPADKAVLTRLKKIKLTDTAEVFIKITRYTAFYAEFVRFLNSI